MARSRGRRALWVAAAGVALVVAPAALASGAVTASAPAAAASVTVTRIGGADRYAVAAGVSLSGYAPDPPVVYIASGRGFADALAAGPVAAYRGGPILLTAPDTLPAATRRELERLRPFDIVIVGGPVSVSAAVETALGAYAVNAVTRVSGATRYEVAANVSKGVFPPSSAPRQYVASGKVFADALSAGSPAGFVNGPIYLANPSAPPASAVQGLAYGSEVPVTIVGGPASVSTAIESAIADRTSVRRIGGADRFEVSAKLSAATFEAGTGTVFLASGRVFPDALSGVPLAASYGGPILLVDTTRIPTAVATELKRLNPATVFVLGGPASVSDAVITQVHTILE